MGNSFCGSQEAQREGRGFTLASPAPQGCSHSQPPPSSNTALLLSPEPGQTSLMASPSHCPHRKPPGTQNPWDSHGSRDRAVSHCSSTAHPWGLHWQLHVSHSTIKITTLPPRMIHDAAEGLPSCYFGSLERELMVGAHGSAGKWPQALPGFIYLLQRCFSLSGEGSRVRDGHLAHTLPAPWALSSHSQAV